MRIVEIGGALSGLQFVLSAMGCEVHNVDPFLDYGSGPYKLSPELELSTLNRLLHTNVTLHRSNLSCAELEGHFDVVYSISTLEHMAPSVVEDTLRVVPDLLTPQGRVVLTLDLFLDVFPFASRLENRWGRNVSSAWIANLLGLDVVYGDRRELYGFPEFSVDHVLTNLSHYVVSGGYPQLCQLMILERSASREREKWE